MAIYLMAHEKKNEKNKYIEKENANKKEQKHSGKKHNQNNKPKKSLSLQTNVWIKYNTRRSTALRMNIKKIYIFKCNECKFNSYSHSYFCGIRQWDCEKKGEC